MGVVATTILVLVLSNPSTKQKPLPIATLTTFPTFNQTLTPTIASTASPTYTPTPTRTIIPTATVIITRVASKDGMVQVYVSAGEFKMGLDSGFDNEKPMHTVYLDGYWIDQTEVTNAQYALCVKAGRCTEPLDLSWRTHNRFNDSQYADHPVVFVDWNQANTYCTWAGRSLPTEAEWEKAARGTDKRLYPWGSDFDGGKVNYCDINCWAGWKGKSDDGYETTSPVGTYPEGASPYGALDMAGNAYEWVQDYSGGYPSDSQRKPTGPTAGTEHILRGGSWGDDMNHVRTVVRSDEPSDFRRDFIGFRCAR